MHLKRLVYIPTRYRCASGRLAAQSLVILTAGIDLSVGAIAVITSVFMGQFTFRYGLPVELAVAAGLQRAP